MCGFYSGYQVRVLSLFFETDSLKEGMPFSHTNVHTIIHLSLGKFSWAMMDIELSTYSVTGSIYNTQI